MATELGVAYLSKDEVKETLMDALGAPGAVEDSRRLGTAAVRALLRVARGCPGAVIDSTWFVYSLPLALALPRKLVEVRCHVPLEVARQRYRARVRDPGHLDALRTEDELWGQPVQPLRVGPLVDVHTSAPVDVVRVAAQIRSAAGWTDPA